MAVAAVTLLGLALRLYGIQGLSFWWDEYTSLAWLDAPSLLDFLRQNTTLDPATLPAYYTLEYLWHHYVSATPDSLRYLSVLLSIPQVPLLYLLGRNTLGRQAGLVAALCLALSPIHVFHAQSIRMYVLFTTFALGSAWTFSRIMQGARWPWWAGHGLFNFLLFWTHPFAPMLLAAEGIALLLMRAPVRRWFTWGMLNVALYLPTAVYMVGVSFWSPQSTGEWLQIPTPTQFLGDLLFDDVVVATYQLRVPTEFWSINAPWILSLRPIMDALCVAGVLACMAFACWQLGRREHKAIIFFLVWLLLPATVLYVLSLVWRPCIFPRYTLYSSMAVYLFAGAAVAALPRVWLRVLAVAGVILAVGFQAGLVLPGAQRTDWRDAAAQVKATGAADVPVVVTVSIDRDTFAYNYMLSPDLPPRPMASAEEVDDAAELVARLIAVGYGSAWAIVAGAWFDALPPQVFEAALDRFGLLHERVVYPGIRPVYVYLVSPSATAVAPAPPPEDAALKRVLALGDLAVELMLHGEDVPAREILDAVLQTHAGQQMAYARLVEALDGQVPVAEACAAVRASIRAGGHISEGRYAKAVEACREAVAHDPGLLVAWYNLLIALLESSRFDEALPVMDHLSTLDIPDRTLYLLIFGHLMEVIRGGGDIQAAYEALEMLRNAEDFEEAGDLEGMRGAVDAALKRDPRYGYAHLYKARLLAKSGKTELARAALVRAAELSPAHIGPMAPALEAFLADHDAERARALAIGLSSDERAALSSLLDGALELP